MPENLKIGAFVFGAVLVLIAILGGNFKLFGAEVASSVSSPLLRFVAFALGAIFFIVAMHPLDEEMPVDSSSPSQKPAQPSSGLTTQPTSTQPTISAPSAPLPSNRTAPLSATQRWSPMGVSTKTGEDVYVDNNSIDRSNGTIQFTYKIGDDIISANADCDSNRWHAKNKDTGQDYGWISPQSQATQRMMDLVCQ